MTEPQDSTTERQGPDPAFSDVYRWHAQLTEEREQRRQQDAHLALAEYRECEGHTDNDQPTIERVQVTHLPGRYGGRITHPWRWELTAPDGEIRYFDTKREALAWWDENKPSDDTHLAHARYLGADAALAAASWLTMSEADATSILDGDGDPEVLDRYPEPDLSGEMAGESIPEIFCDFDDPHDPALHDAWEEGRDGCWSDAVEATAYRVLGNIPMALAIEASNEAYVASLRTAAGL